MQILSMCPYRDAVRTASVSRGWEHLHAQLPVVRFPMSRLGLRASLGKPSEPRVQSMERTLRRRCHEVGHHHTVKTLQIGFRKNVSFESRYADEFIALANASRLELHVQCEPRIPNEDAGEWSLELPPATTELRLRFYWYAVRPPRVHGPGVSSLRWLALDGLTVLRQVFLRTVFPSLEELHIVKCTLPASIEITSDSMPHLKRLRITNVTVMNDSTAGITVLADELTTLHVSCDCPTEPMSSSDPAAYCLRPRFRSLFNRYSCFHLRAPKLHVFHWSCCFADEVCVESVGRLSDVAVELAAGRLPRPWNEESKSLSVEECNKLMKGILGGLMPGLHPCCWNHIQRKCIVRDERWLSFEISSAP
ncbi:hypothetical protein E2562_029944 [Oryza meyeriana var. granulata]|uniref:FBD domain-containing protein n=1 Tax=Oryza meyeriana var. granulata TaxID=110450 RepID=A0A6G1CUM4_9ORYZ|nr:hypothetical protein E2562_029944 [Oryza meyeriana var. granulata]